MSQAHYCVSVTCHKQSGSSQTHTWQGFASSDSEARENAKASAQSAMRDCISYETKIVSKR